MIVQTFGRALRHISCFAVLFAFALSAPITLAQDDEDDYQDDESEFQREDDVVDEITVTGSQIKGAHISDALAVSVISAENIEIIGVESGDELLDMIPEMGQNFFSETDTAGGVNAARGDVGAINMRNLGTGNTLVLLNGRRLVNMATYQTEEVGGSFVPVNSVNSNHIPVYGVDRIEILRDGASAIYGADAVAGVVNTVLKNDYEGFRFRVRHTDFDHMPRDDQSIGIEWGDKFNGGATRVGVFARYYQRDRVNSRDETRWFRSDLRYRFPDSSPYSEASGSTVFRNDSANSLWGRFDVIPSLPSSHSLRQNDVTDSSGEFELFPINHPDCTGPAIDLGNGNCMREDSSSRGVRYNLNDNRDLLSELERTTIYAYANHDLDSGLEVFGDLYWYDSSTNRINQPAVDLAAVPLRVGASNYYNPLGPVGSPNRLPDSIIGTDVPPEGYELNMDLYRFAEYPRIVDNDGEAIRLLAGLRGTAGRWDWESALTWSEASRDDITHNRLSNTLLTQALFDPTPAAYNPFSAGVDSNIERALVDVFRKGETTLAMWDLKFSTNELFDLPAGPVGFVAGYEYRRETYEDDRDPRLDGTIRFERDTDGDGTLDFEGDFEGDTYPFTSDVVNSSPTPDGAGSRKTNSLFAEFQVPLHATLDVQLAARYEDFDDVGDTTVGKIAFGWRPINWFLLRGSWSEAFRAPNLITINEQIIARSNTLNDWVCFYGEDQGTLDEDCDYGIQRRAQGSRSLVPEESENSSIGIVLEPLEGLTFTADFWSIEKDNTIGLFGEENHMLYDLVLRLDAGTGDCSNPQSLGNPLVQRLPHDPTDTDLVDGFLAAGLCPVGPVDFVDDSYLNLDTRKLEGYDIGIYYQFETPIGEFDLSYNGSYYTKFEQTASSTLSREVIAAKNADPTIVYPLIGLGDLLGIDGNQEDRHSAIVAWRRNDTGASIQAFRIGSFDEVLSNGDLFPIPSMTTYNASFEHRFDIADVNTRVRLGINNFTDERAPLADESFGFFKDAHRDWGIYYYLDVLISL
ncbi:MAG: TonB-dependent receptor [Woeseiaceae bacterium]|nr:TonB-dependent receptor [Woeseiaceae bacterium]